MSSLFLTKNININDVTSKSQLIEWWRQQTSLCMHFKDIFFVSVHVTNLNRLITDMSNNVCFIEGSQCLEECGSIQWDYTLSHTTLNKINDGLEIIASKFERLMGLKVLLNYLEHYFLSHAVEKGSCADVRLNKFADALVQVGKNVDSLLKKEKITLDSYTRQLNEGIFFNLKKSELKSGFDEEISKVMPAANTLKTCFHDTARLSNLHGLASLKDHFKNIQRQWELLSYRHNFWQTRSKETRKLDGKLQSVVCALSEDDAGGSGVNKHISDLKTLIIDWKLKRSFWSSRVREVDALQFALDQLTQICS